MALRGRSPVTAYRASSGTVHAREDDLLSLVVPGVSRRLSVWTDMQSYV